MNHPQFLRNVWTDPRFHTLSQPVQLLLCAAIFQADIAGWWAPTPRNIAADIPGCDLAADLPKLAPWLRVHPTGWVSVKGYLAAQGVSDINSDSGFIKGCRRVLMGHREREMAAGAVDDFDGLKNSEAKPTSAPDLDPARPSKSGHQVTTRKPPRGHESQEPQVPKSQVPSQESPTRGSGGEPEAGPLPCPTDDLKLQGVLGLYLAYRHAVPTDQPLWALQTLQRAAQARNWDHVQRAAIHIFEHSKDVAPTLKELARGLDRALLATCHHGAEGWRYWTMAAGRDLPAGQKQRFKGCEAPGCRHFEPVGEAFWPEHECDMHEVEGLAYVLPAGSDQMVMVKKYNECVLCGRQAAIVEQSEVAA